MRIDGYPPQPLQRRQQQPRVERFAASQVIATTLTQPVNRQKGISIYAGGSAAPHILAEVERWSEVFGREGFHTINGAGNGPMEANRRGIQRVGGLAMATNIHAWDEGNRGYDHHTMHDTLSERFDGPGGFYAMAQYGLMLPGKFGTKSEAYRLIYDMMSGKTQYPIQRRLVVADLDPAFSQWIREQFNAESYGADRYIVFVKTPEAAMAVFNDPTIPLTDGINS